jgi:hypothetical protein
MPKTNAERQRDYRQRRARRITVLEAENTSLRAQLDSTRSELDAALAETERLASAACKHPAGAVDGGTCRACGAEVW